MNNFYLDPIAIRVNQPLGAFFVTSISARKLLNITYSAPAITKEDGTGIDGTQRLESEKRLKEIADYIGTKEAAFPNAIIIGANYSEDGYFHGDDDEISWKYNNGKLTIPTEKKLGSIIDGQHRLHAFNYCADKDKDIELLCAVYIDLPIPFHAFLFSTINFNQKKVDRSLAYNLFGFDIESSDENTWVPETLAVSIARRLNLEESPFKDKVSLGLADKREYNTKWQVSMAAIVDGILKLISKNPKKDRHDLLSISKSNRTRDKLENNDGTPLRFLYIEGYDEAIYEIIFNYFSAMKQLIWDNAPPDTFITKTVGIQASFDVLLSLLNEFKENLDGDLDYFITKLSAAKNVPFTGIEASGKGRSQIKKMLLVLCDIRKPEQLGINLHSAPYSQITKKQ
ncbi:DGQHR domain-containing protein [Parendozoicomonas sp. Alg238-R29]|uniref:DGQHR domain-containing protein n=1 Tax=Parendozoicomonas sp. Alg238-R29 TaxID=2993446 RepID=UPI00248F16AB|nr:DGQHR domain-containing protein [Parendozoicomonas sp. Alg238-R29]